MKCPERPTPRPVMKQPSPVVLFAVLLLAPAVLGQPFFSSLFRFPTPSPLFGSFPSFGNGLAASSFSASSSANGGPTQTFSSNRVSAFKPPAFSSNIFSNFPAHPAPVSTNGIGNFGSPLNPLFGRPNRPPADLTGSFGHRGTFGSPLNSLFGRPSRPAANQTGSFGHAGGSAFAGISSPNAVSHFSSSSTSSSSSTVNDGTGPHTSSFSSFSSVAE